MNEYIVPIGGWYNINGSIVYLIPGEIIKLNVT